MKLLIPGFFLILIGFPSYGQKPDNDKIEALRVQHITEELELEPGEAQKFWPLYNEYRKKLERIKSQRIDHLIEQKKLICSDISEMTEAEAEKLLNTQLARENDFVELREEYYTKFKEVLSAKKAAKLYSAELDFHKKLIDRLSK